MSTIYEALEKSALACDGAMGTMLQNAGLTDGGSPELWNVEKPEEDEQLVIKKLPFEEVYQMVLRGEIRDGLSVGSILKAYAVLNKR